MVVVQDPVVQPLSAAVGRKVGDWASELGAVGGVGSGGSELRVMGAVASFESGEAGGRRAIRWQRASGRGRDLGHGGELRVRVGASSAAASFGSGAEPQAQRRQ